MGGAGEQSGTRRGFLKTMVDWAKWLIAVLLLYPLFRFLRHSVPEPPQLVELHLPLKPGGFLLHQEFVLFEAEEGPWAVSRICTHLGCRLNFQQNDNELLCPCHASRFSPAGKRLAGPAQRDLPLFAAERIMDGDRIKGYRVTL